MTIDEHYERLEARLSRILAEMEVQHSVGQEYAMDMQPFAEQMKQLHEWIDDVGEYGIAYEEIVATLESSPFRLSGIAAVALLELGLLFRYKTDREQDKMFDGRVGNT